MLPENYRELIQTLLQAVPQGEDFESFENGVQALVMGLARDLVKARLEKLAAEQRKSFREGSTRWSPVLQSSRSFMTSFGVVRVERPLFRATRNGPTRCLLTERAQIVRGFWTPRATKLVAHVCSDLSFDRAKSFIAEFGALNPSAASIRRLIAHLSGIWEANRESYEQKLREAFQIPAEATSIAVSIDGVMVNMLGSAEERKAKKAKAKGKGRPPKGPSGYKECSVGVLSYYDEKGTRLATRRFARMPEPNKATTKRWLKNELDHARRQRPDLTVVAVADGAVNNWGFLKSLQPDHEVVDYYHAVTHLHRHLHEANGASSLDTQTKFAEMKRLLLEEPQGAQQVFRELAEIQKEAKTAEKKRGKKESKFFDLHAKRMNYAELRANNLPIGSGVVEGACRHLVVDRLRRSGMRWGLDGGQAVMTLRAIQVSGDFAPAWNLLRQSLRQAA